VSCPHLGQPARWLRHRPVEPADDLGLPLWVEGRPIGAPVEGCDNTLPLHPDGLGDLSPFR